MTYKVIGGMLSLTQSINQSSEGLLMLSNSERLVIGTMNSAMHFCNLAGELLMGHLV